MRYASDMTAAKHSPVRTAAIAAGAVAAVVCIIFVAAVGSPIPLEWKTMVFTVALYPLMPVALTTFGISVWLDAGEITMLDAVDSVFFLLCSIVITVAVYALVAAAATWAWLRLRRRWKGRK